MSEFVSCERCKYATEDLNGKHCGCCKHNESQRCIENFTHITNADRIRSMSDEELTEFIADYKIEKTYAAVCHFNGACRKLHSGWCPVLKEDSMCPYSDKEMIEMWLQSEAESEEV